MEQTINALLILLFVVVPSAALVWLLYRVSNGIVRATIPETREHARDYRPFGGARETARRLRQLKRGIIRTN